MIMTPALCYALTLVTATGLSVALAWRRRIGLAGLFCLVLAVGSLLFWGSVILSSDPEDQLLKYFMPGTLDDFFTPMMKFRENTYVDPHFSDYPALPNIIYLVFRRLISPGDVTAAGLMETRLEGSQYLSMTMGGKLLPLLFYVAAFVGLYMTLDQLLERGMASSRRRALLLCLCLSGPFLFILQRGNNIIVPIVLAFFFLNNYESKSGLLRELAIVALAVATAMKMYPVLFGLLLLRQGDRAYTLRAILYGVLAMFVPFLVYDGLTDIGHFIQNIFTRNAYKESTIYGFNYSVSFLASARILVRALFGVELDGLPLVANLIPVAFCGATFFAARERWQQVAAISLAMMWIPSASYTYLICFLAYPLLLLLMERGEGRALRLGLVTCLALMFVPYGLPRLAGYFSEAHANLQLTVGMVVVHLAIWAFAALLAASVFSGLGGRRLAGTSGEAGR